MPDASILSETFEHDLSRIKRSLSDRQRDALLEKANVCGTALGPREVSGRWRDEPSLVVLVEKKQPAWRLTPDDMVPKRVECEDGTVVRTDVQETGRIRDAVETVETRDVTTTASTDSDTTGSINENNDTGAGVGIGSGTDADGSEDDGAPIREERIRPVLGGLRGASSAGYLFTTSDPYQTEDGDTVLLTTRSTVTDGGSISGVSYYQPSGVTDDPPIGETSQWLSATPGGQIANAAATGAVVIEIDDPEDVAGYILGLGVTQSTDRAGFGDRVASVSYRNPIQSGDLLNRDVRTVMSLVTGDDVLFTGLHSFDLPRIGGAAGAPVVTINPSTDEISIVGIYLGGSDTRSLMVPMRAIENEFGDLTPLGAVEEPEEAQGSPGGIGGGTIPDIRGRELPSGDEGDRDQDYSADDDRRGPPRTLDDIDLTVGRDRDADGEHETDTDEDSG